MAEMEDVPDDLRCSRSDGRQWRCKRRAMEGKKMCDIHHLQLNMRQHRQKVPESLKLVRSKKVVESSGTELISGIRAQRSGKTSKRTRVMCEAEAVDEAVRKMKLKRGDVQLDLIRMVLKREAEKMKKPRDKKKKESDREFDDFKGSEEELTRVLPNGVMAISSSSPNTINAASPCDIKVRTEPISGSRRRFRSKNIEPYPVGKAVPFKENLTNARKKKKKRCHWCGSKALGNLVCCFSCRREFFCLNCIEKRNAGSREEVERECPICRESCRCKACSVTMSGVTECKDVLSSRSEIDRVLHLHYVICMLLPVLKQINAEHKVELEREGEMKGPSPAELHIQSSELSSTLRHHRSYCNSATVDMDRGCHCDKDQCHGSPPKKGKSIVQKCSNDSLPDLLIAKNLYPKDSRRVCELGHSSSEELIHRGSLDVSGELSSTDREVSWCGNDYATLTIKLEISAEEIVSCYELPEILDKSSGCSFCLGMESGKVKLLKEAANREDADGNFLYYPMMTDFNHNNLEHFQMHWSKGQPVIVQSVLRGASDLEWDPVAMFCAHLQNSNRNSQNDEADKTTNSLDWFEVDIGVNQIFLGSLRGNAEINACEEKLKLQGWVSSRLFEEQFPSHYAEVLNILPIPHYMDPESGLLNIAAKLPVEIQKPDLGPCLNIYYRSGEEFAEPDSVQKLGFEFCDKVDILLHVTEASVSTKQICKIKKLMKRKKAQDRMADKERDASRTVNDEVISIDKLRPDNYGKYSKSRLDRAKKQSGFASEGCDQSHKDREASCTGDDCSDYSSGSDSEYEDMQIQGAQRERCDNSTKEEDLGSSYGAQWDIFQRQDAPKLAEYLKKHSHKLKHTRSSRKQVSDALLGQSYYLDAYHKAKLKEEFGIEPWTFDQHVGEAVIIPAGCPYQIRKIKSCVNVVLNFVSPEHVAESIQRADELCLLPHHCKPKVPSIEMKKVAIHKISEAIKEIRKLTS